MTDHLKRTADTGHLLQGPDGHLVCRRHCQIMLCFVDEASPYTDAGGATTYDADLAAYLNLTQPGRKAGCLVPTTSGSSAEELVLPVDRSEPDQISVEKIARSPSESDLTAEFDRIRSGAEPRNVVISIDGSGSMTRQTIEPGIDQFKSWVAATYPDAVVTERTFTTERWVDEMRDALVDVFGL